ncbi:MAG: TrkH family potassium uptake protein [Candidatus Bruticola sp.]
MLNKVAAIYNRFGEATSGSAFSSAAITLAPLAFIFLGLDLDDGSMSLFRSTCAVLTLIFTVFIGLFWDRHPSLGKYLALADALACVGAAGRYLFSDPFSALTVFVAVSVLVNAVVHYQGDDKTQTKYSKQEGIESIGGAVGGFAGLFFITWFLCGLDNQLGLSLCACGGLICQLIFYKWSLKLKSRLPKTIVLICFFSICLSFIAQGTWLTVTCLALTIFLDVFFVNSYGNLKLREDFGVDFFLNRPARFLLLTFVLLCTVGSVLLYLPISSDSSLNYIDAAFMAVSASCVTGLTCLDLEHDFTVYGKVFLAILVQLGGLGMMGTASLAMHAMGRRLSLRHERLLASLSETESGPNLMRSLYIIVIYVFVLESIGASVMTICLMGRGMPFSEAFGKAAFMAISAFCNAGMTPESGNLVNYVHTPGILYTVAILVICGGMSPLTFWALPLWFRRRHISLASFLALATTALLLLLGTVAYLTLEWNGIFAQLAPFDKLHNAFFLSAVGRTAGFNAVDVSTLSPLSTLMTLVFMLIGGCPGGTAGGMKTVTVAIMFLSFWSDLNQEKEVVCRRRLVPHYVVRRTITILVAFMLTLTAALILLFMTQTIAPKLLLFEAVSALGTVGLSLGATSQLDEIGKIIVMFTMFCGRIGPISIFAVMADYKSVKHEVGYPQEHIPLT